MKNAIFRSLLLVLTACGNPAAEFEPQRAAVLKKLEAFEAIGTEASGTGPVRGHTLSVPGPAPSFPSGPGSGNAVVISMDDFADLTTSSKKSRLVSVNPVQRVAAWARKNRNPWGSDLGNKDIEALRSQIPAFLQLKYLLVARTLHIVEPQIMGNGFAGETFNGDALLFDLDERKGLGGISFKAKNDQTVTVDDRQRLGWLTGNLQQNAMAALAAEFKQRFPAASPPAENAR
ncbi:MAG: hypothetical protein HY293_18350 [Planctomycetes bacterium]|nr:hypothetical protein [Planctomycetota bacterium]